MKNNAYVMLAGFIGLVAWVTATPSLAEPALQAEPLSYSPDRWPARWSSIVRQNQASDYGQAYGYGSYQSRPVRNENPWTHNSSALFEVPAGHRPWGEPPRKTRRQQVRGTGRYRDQQRQPAYQANPMYNSYAYGGGMPPVYPGPGYLSPFGSPAGLGLTYPYGVSPMLGSPLLTSPLAGYPYGAYPGVPGRMNWPFGAW